jgi:hypothetical protein
MEDDAGSGEDTVVGNPESEASIVGSPKQAHRKTTSTAQEASPSKAASFLAEHTQFKASYKLQPFSAWFPKEVDFTTVRASRSKFNKEARRERWSLAKYEERFHALVEEHAGIVDPDGATLRLRASKLLGAKKIIPRAFSLRVDIEPTPRWRS